MQPVIAAAEGSHALDFLTQFGVEWQLLLSQGISFAIVAGALYWFVFRPVIKASTERQVKIEQGLKDADEAREKLASAQEAAKAQIDAAASEASKLLKQARDDAKSAIDRAASEASAKAAEIRERNSEQLERDKALMKLELKAELSGLVVKAAEAVAGEVLTPEQKGRLAEIAAKKLEG